VEEAENTQTPPTPPNFNWALLLGLCAIAISIFAAGITIANRLPQTFHGHMTGSLTGGSTWHDTSSREFMSEWEAANFLLMGHDEFASILQTGELSGTYTVFQVERREWVWSQDELGRMLHPPAPLPYNVRVVGEQPVPVHPFGMEYEIVLVDHRIFSRERLSEWLINRIDQ